MGKGNIYLAGRYIRSKYAKEMNLTHDEVMKIVDKKQEIKKRRIKMKTNIRNKGMSLILAFVMIFTAFYVIPAQPVEAATEYITVEAYAKSMAEELKLTPVKGSASSGYVNALLKTGIIKEGDFTSYKSHITRGETMVLLNRADEYLYGDTLDAKLVQLAIDKRISDISKVKKSKRTDVAKAYLKGYVKGFSNGKYSSDRTMKVKSKFVKKDALNCLKLLKDTSKRAKISPDGQLIRTTKLPKNANMFPYILDSFPNDYYDWLLRYEKASRTSYNPATDRMENKPYVYLEEYASPADIDKITYVENFAELKKEKLDIWVSKVKTHVECIFNVDYRTIGQDWINKVASVNYTYGYGTMEEQTRERLLNYVNKVKEEKTVIELDNVALDGSSIYFFDGRFYLRVFVRYRIVTTENNYRGGTFYEKNSLFYTSSPLHLNDIKLGDWVEACFEVTLTHYSARNRENIGTFRAELKEYYYTDYKY